MFEENGEFDFILLLQNGQKTVIAGTVRYVDVVLGNNISRVKTHIYSCY